MTAVRTDPYQCERWAYRIKGVFVAESGDPKQPVAGVYEQLITRTLHDRLERLEAAGWKAIDEEVSKESTPHVLARHIGEAVGRRLSQLPQDQQVIVANQVLRSLAVHAPDPEVDEVVGAISAGPRQLLALAEHEAPASTRYAPSRPSLKPH